MNDVVGVGWERERWRKSKATARKSRENAQAIAAAYAADATASHAADAASSTAQSVSLARSADLVRERFPRAPKLVTP